MPPNPNVSAIRRMALSTALRPAPPCAKTPRHPPRSRSRRLSPGPGAPGLQPRRPVLPSRPMDPVPLRQSPRPAGRGGRRRHGRRLLQRQPAGQLPGRPDRVRRPLLRPAGRPALLRHLPAPVPDGRHLRGRHLHLPGRRERLRRRAGRLRRPGHRPRPLRRLRPGLRPRHLRRRRLRLRPGHHHLRRPGRAVRRHAGRHRPTAAPAGTPARPAPTCEAGTCRCPAAAPDPAAAACVDPQTDERHCGACGAPPAPPAPPAPAAPATAPASQAACGTAPGACVDRSTDEANCGTCGTACATGATCTGGTCGCPGGQTTCGSAPGVCADLSTDRDSLRHLHHRLRGGPVLHPGDLLPGRPARLQHGRRHGLLRRDRLLRRRLPDRPRQRARPELLRLRAARHVQPDDRPAGRQAPGRPRREHRLRSVLLPAAATPGRPPAACATWCYDGAFTGQGGAEHHLEHLPLPDQASPDWN